MKKILSICMFEVGKVFKRRQSYLVMFAMPLVFTLLFGSLLDSEGSTDKIEISVVDEDQSTLSKRYLEMLTDNESFSFTPSTLAEAEGRVLDKKLTGFIVIDKNFEELLLSDKQPQIMFKHGPEFTSGMIVSEIIGNKLINLAIEAKGAVIWSEHFEEEWEPKFQEIAIETSASKPSVESTIITKQATNKEMDNMSERAAGFAIMFVMIVMMSSTGTILEAKSTGVWSRLLTTPTAKSEIMLGYLAAFFIIGWVQFGILMVTSTLLFNVSWGNMVGIIALVSAILVCVIGLGLVISSYAKSVEQQAALGNLIIISTCMLGGVFWPLEVVPEFMQKIAEFIPQTWAMKGFTEIVARGGTIADIVLPVTILMGFAIVFLSLGIRRVRFE
ncbi:ABC transporter permease [Fredinandcohnia sp. 179-A 10B2 NHS]|uniref:ABC transporter permease n=1 Tax=Fredinandcohnia sp. 179-A 10B2 NHS TaxID=3235176 RepID=UPI00399F7BDF